MNKCIIDTISLRQIRTKVSSPINRYLVESKLGKGDLGNLKKKFVDAIKSISENYEMDSSVVDTIYDTTRHIRNIDPGFFTKENIQNILTNSDAFIQEVNPQQADSDIITADKQIRLRTQANNNFLYEAYGMATAVQIAAMNQANMELFDCLFINRGSINGNRGIVTTNIALNDNIRAYQQKLLERICKYLTISARNSKQQLITNNLKALINNPQLYTQINGEWQNTGILEKLYNIINQLIMQNKQSLAAHYYNMQNANTEELRNNSKILIEAYNSAVLLRNFDTYLVTQLAKSLNIKDFNRLTGEDKYSLSGNTSNIATTWRTSENINVEAEVSNITKMAINTTPIRKNGIMQVSSNRYLHFQDFQHIISKIKDLGYNSEARKIVLNMDEIENLSQDAIEFLQNKTLSQAINLIRKNPREYTSHIFELLSDQKFQERHSEIFSKGDNKWTLDELDKLWSISKGIFNGPESLASIEGINSDIDYLSYITQVADSIFNIKFLQYYKGNDGTIQARTLLGQNIFNIKRSIIQTINTANSKQLSNWIKEKENFSIYELTDTGNNFTGIRFKIPNTDYYVHVSKAQGQVRILNPKNVQITDVRNLWKQQEIKDFVENILHLNIINDVDYWNAFVYEQGSEITAINSLIQAASRTLMGKYIASEKVKNSKGIKAESDVRNLLGIAPNERSHYEYNYTLDELGVTHFNDGKTYTDLAIAEGNLQGVTTSTIVKDAEGNGQSQQSLSRLLGSIWAQFELQEKSPNSVMNESLLLTNPDILEEIYTAKEFSSPDNIKSLTDMNVSELAYSQFILDFIGGLSPKKNDYDQIGNGQILLYPSVNSDKSTIGRIRINLNAVVNGKKLINYSNDELKLLIGNEFSKVYGKIVNNIQSDFRLIDNFIAQRYSLPSLADDFVNGFANWNAAIDYLKQTGQLSEDITPTKFLKQIVREYNAINRLNPISITDQVHFIDRKGYLASNNSIFEQINRYSSIDNSTPFWKQKNVEILKDILKSNLQINTENNAYLKDNLKNWIDQSNNLIIAKVMWNGKKIPITSMRDVIKIKGDNISTNDFLLQVKDTLEINPLIEQYNLLDYLFTQEFIIASVGSFIAHPAKGSFSNVLEEEAARFQAQHKRNVSFTAAMHEFQIGILNGIPTEYNVAVVDQIHDAQPTIHGEISDIQPFDGATFVNPFVVILENNSLGGASAGITKKQFVHFKDSHTGTGGIIKTAGFGLTNDWIRNSQFLQRMMKKMTDHVWLNENGTPAIIDIFRGYKGEVSYNFNNIFYFKQGGKFFKASINSLGNNQYQRTLQEIDITGKEIGQPILEEVQLVNTNYKLWNLFGGANSMAFNNGKLQYSNISVENVVTTMNNIGTVRNNANNVNTQRQLWQPLKKVDVHYLATSGAVKQGAANTNAESSYWDDTPLDIMKIKLNQIGIQLDKEHHADDQEVSLTTQVISACASRGFTFEQAASLYKALSTVTEINLSKELNSFRSIFNGDISESQFRDVMMHSLIKALGKKTSSTSNFIEVMASEVIKQVQNGEIVDFSSVNLPLSDNTIYAKIISTVNSYITKSGIKQKIPGILSVLTPSYGIMKLYAGRKLESFTNFEEEIAALQQMQQPIVDSQNGILNITNLELGRYYQITELIPTVTVDPLTGEITEVAVPTTTTRLISSPQEYMELKNAVNEGKVIQVVESLKEGRDLAAYNVRFNTITGDRFQLWDLDSSQALFLLQDIKKSPNIEVLQNVLQSLGMPNTGIINETNYNGFWEIAKTRVYRQLQQDLHNLNPDSNSVFEQYQILLNSRDYSPEWYRRYTAWVNTKLGTGNGSRIAVNSAWHVIDKTNFDQLEPLVREQLILPLDKVSINGVKQTIDKSSIRTQAYEIIMPKTFATAFGLDEFADLNTIQNDPDYFIKQLIQNFSASVNPKNYTIAFKRANGRHLYVLDSSQIGNSEGLQKLQNIKIFIDEDGRKYRTDINDNIMYEISDDTEIYIDSLGNEIIASSDIDFYVNSLSADTIQLSSQIDDSSINSIYNILQNSSSKVAEDFVEFVEADESEESNVFKVRKVNKRLSGINLINYSKLSNNHPIIKAGRYKHSSFLKSLDVITSRTPAQSQQSFMAMRTVAFDNPNINTAFVSTMQILLQGSK